jgi:hypothetical protein
LRRRRHLERAFRVGGPRVLLFALDSARRAFERALSRVVTAVSSTIGRALEPAPHFAPLELAGEGAGLSISAAADELLPPELQADVPAHCPECGSPVSADVLGGLCPRCLLGGTLASLEARGERVGDYVLGERIDGGGMGEIYLGTHVETGLAVAIKFARPELLATADGVALFRNEINTMSRLRHPNIARVFPSACHGRKPYFVMELLEGGTLEDPRNSRRYRAPRAAAELVSTLASAVQCAHSHGVLHCDIKPANILFDLVGEPHVADFGLGRLLDDVCSPVLLPGTPRWRSPEQVQQKSGSAASDVFQLGLLLEWLLTGKFAEPVTAATAAPLRWAPTLECSLEAISRRARSYDPTERYRTAAELTDELERALRNEPLKDELSRPLRRLLRWAHRQKFVAALLVSAICLLAALPFMVDALLGDMRAWISEQNQFVAKAQALAVRNQLQVDANTMEKMARDEAIQSLTTWGDLTRSPSALARHQGRFDNLFLFSRDGTFQARYPLPNRFRGTTNYLFRDYHQCAIALGERVLAQGGPGTSIPVCVSRIFRSTTDAQLKFSLAAPLIHKGELVGVANGSIQARDRFAGLEMRCGPGQCTTGLIGPRDRDDPRSPLPATLVVFAHPSLKLPAVNPRDPKDERRLDAATVQHICSKLRCTPDRDNPFGDPETGPIVLDEFEEPVTRQRSVVALAPVGRTGLITMVSTPDAAMEEIRLGLRRRAWMFVWIPLLAGMMLLSSVLVFPQTLRVLAQRRRRKESADG